eukprot:scaffold111_cov252-Pinguiococcus_pyrenoidosus.AAC.17
MELRQLEQDVHPPSGADLVPNGRPVDQHAGVAAGALVRRRCGLRLKQRVVADGIVPPALDDAGHGLVGTKRFAVEAE